MRPFGAYHRPFDIIIKMQANKHLSFGVSQNITLTKSKYNLQNKYNFDAIRTAAAQKKHAVGRVFESLFILPCYFPTNPLMASSISL